MEQRRTFPDVVKEPGGGSRAHWDPGRGAGVTRCGWIRDRAGQERAPQVGQKAGSSPHGAEAGPSVALEKPLWGRSRNRSAVGDLMPLNGQQTLTAGQTPGDVGHAWGGGRALGSGTSTWVTTPCLNLAGGVLVDITPLEVKKHLILLFIFPIKFKSN